jgi:HK97 family phage portal protein
MSLVVSSGRLEAVERPWAPAMPMTSMRLYGELTADYSSIYRTQPSVRMVISFVARNIGQLGLHVFRRVSDTDRERLTDHGLAQTIARPNPTTTRYRLLDDLVHDVAIFGNAYWAKVKADGRVGLVRLPAARVRPLGDNPFKATEYELTGNAGRTTLPAEQIVHFRLHNPDDPRVGVSPLESLRQVLAESMAADTYREQFWRSGARTSGYIKRPAGMDWSDTARGRFRESWRSRYTGDGPDAGGTPILEDGMEYVPTGITARDAQYLEARKLTREEVATAFHIPPPMVGLLDHATFSNVEQQHRMLYQDTLGPWLKMIEEEIELQLLPEYSNTDRVYVEFNLQEKLKGSFEEQATSLQSAVGRPWMTADEARARMNLPSMGGDATELVTPLNVLIGGQASPTDSAPVPGQASLNPEANLPQGQQVARPTQRDGVRLASREGTRPNSHRELLTGYLSRQRDVVLSRMGAKRQAFDEGRWQAELEADLTELGLIDARSSATALTAELKSAIEQAGDPDGVRAVYAKALADVDQLADRFIAQEAS